MKINYQHKFLDCTFLSVITTSLRHCTRF